MIQATATEFKSNFGKYLSLVAREEIHITKNGTDVAVLVSPAAQRSWIDDLTGIIPDSDSVTSAKIKKNKAERLAKKYESLG